MIPRKSGLIITIGSPGSIKYLFSVLYGVQKEGVSFRLGIKNEDLHVFKRLLIPSKHILKMFGKL